jgi:hypothetical protein
MRRKASTDSPKSPPNAKDVQDTIKSNTLRDFFVRHAKQKIFSHTLFYQN